MPVEDNLDLQVQMFEYGRQLGEQKRRQPQDDVWTILSTAEVEMIAAGDRVTLWYPSGNRDEKVFESPFRFDIGRAPNQHVAFGGGGPHFCLGANLARFEISILFEELLARTHEIEVLQPPKYSVLGIHNPILTAMSELPVRLA
jgi:cytochrome P450